MEHSNEHRIAKAFLLGWAILFFLYSLLGTWLSTGPDALAGPSTTKENIWAGLWLGLSILQLVLAVIVNKRDKPWLFWFTTTLVVLSVSMIAGPLLMLLVFK